MRLWFSVIIRLLLSVLLFCSLANADSRPLKITFIDVGEGDATLLELPDHQNFVIDSGNLKTAPDIFKLLQQRKITNVAKVFFSHPHLDHIGGYGIFSKLLTVQEFIDNGQPIELKNIDDTYRWYLDAIRASPTYKTWRQGDFLSFAGGSLSALWPMKGELDADWNNNSLILKLQYGSFRALFMGDALSPTELKLVESSSDLRANILKAGHHGSAGTADPKFLEKVKPELVIISVNKNNIRGYPDPDVVTRFTKSSPVLRTDENGSVTVEVSESGKYSFSSLKVR